MKMTKNRLFLFLTVALLLSLLCVGVASAANEPLKVSMELSTYKLSEPREIKVSISVANVGEGDMPSPVTLYYPNNKQVAEFGSPTLGVGVSKSWSGTWKVTQAQLDAGKITFKIKYSVFNDSGELVNKTKTFSRAITYTGGSSGVEINRTISPSMADKGQEVAVTYDVVNTGTVDITGVTVKDTISKSSGKIGNVKAGEKGSYTFRVKMGTKDLTSQGTVTYKANGKSNTEKLESKTIKYGKVGMTAKLKADKKGGAPGETVKLTLTVKNTGTEDFTDVTVTDAALGTVFSDQAVAAGKTLELTKDVTITENQDLQFTVTAKGSEGDVETTTERVSLVATDPAEQIILNVETTADRETVGELPGKVRFTVTVTNNSNIDISNVDVKATGVKVYTFPVIEAGESRTFSRDINISMAGQYQFMASCKDALDQTVSFGSNVLYIGYAQPTAAPTQVPVVTAKPLVLPDEPVRETMNPEYIEIKETAGSLKWIFLGVGLACLTLLVIGAIRRGIAAKESEAAYDHLDSDSYRDYTRPVRNQKRRMMEDDEPRAREAAVPVPDEPETEKPMPETLRRLYEEGQNRGPAEVTIEEQPVQAQEGQQNGPRRRNDNV